MPQGIDDLEKYEDRQSLFIMSVKKESSSPDKGAPQKEPSFSSVLAPHCAYGGFWFLASLQRIHGSRFVRLESSCCFWLGELIGNT